MAMTYFTLEELDRAIYNVLRLGLIAGGLLPDISTFAVNDEDGYQAAKKTLSHVVEIFGVGSTLNRDIRSASKLVINRRGTDIGGLSGWNLSELVPDGAGGWSREALPDGTKDLTYEIRLITDETKIERVVTHLVYALMQNGSYLTNYTDYTTAGDKCFQVISNGDVDVSQPELMERVYYFTVPDVWIRYDFEGDLGELLNPTITSGIVPLNSVKFLVNLCPDDSDPNKSVVTKEIKS